MLDDLMEFLALYTTRGRIVLKYIYQTSVDYSLTPPNSVTNTANITRQGKINFINGLYHCTDLEIQSLLPLSDLLYDAE